METQKTTSKSKGLGRGIGALIPGGQLSSVSAKNVSSDRTYFMCDIERIIPNKHQPREVFDSAALSELSKSIKENGVIQPLIVRRKGDSFELIAGERRLKASMLAGLRKVPVVIRDVSDRQTLEMALIENIQRDDLSCVEEAKAYKDLMTNFMMTQEQVAIKVGKERATVANMVRLLLLPEEIQNDLLDKKLSMGHARAILSISSEKKQLEIRDKIIRDNLSVRETENLVKKIKEGKESKKEKQGKTDFTYLVEELKKNLETKVEVKGKANKGKIIIHYTSETELDRIFNIMVE